MGLYVFSLPITLVMIGIIYILCLSIIIKSEVWIITHCLGLGHETMLSTVCFYIFLCDMTKSGGTSNAYISWPTKRYSGIPHHFKISTNKCDRKHFLFCVYFVCTIWLLGCKETKGFVYLSKSPTIFTYNYKSYGLNTLCLKVAPNQFCS